MTQTHSLNDHKVMDHPLIRFNLFSFVVVVVVRVLFKLIRYVYILIENIMISFLYLVQKIDCAQQSRSFIDLYVSSLSPSNSIKKFLLEDDDDDDDDMATTP